MSGCRVSISPAPYSGADQLGVSAGLSARRLHLVGGGVLQVSGERVPSLLRTSVQGRGDLAPSPRAARQSPVDGGHEIGWSLVPTVGDAAVSKVDQDAGVGFEQVVKGLADDRRQQQRSRIGKVSDGIM